MASTSMQPEITLSFPAVRGIQASREYYVAMIPLRHLPQLIRLDLRDVPVECRAQRFLNKGRIPQIKRYLLNNRQNYVLSSLTASIGGEVQFEPLADDPIGRRLGRLHLSADTPIVINDGQHRRAAIEEALQEAPELGRETISVVLFVDAKLERSQQRFADLNRYTVRPAKSVAILYDHRDPLSRLVAEVVDAIPTLQCSTEKVKTTISNRARRLFTLSGLYQATKALLDEPNANNLNTSHEELAIEFWSRVIEQFPDWTRAATGDMHPADLRASFVHAHGVALQAIAIAGRELIAADPHQWRSRINALGNIDWSRGNTELWEGRALQNGKISKSRVSIQRTADLIKSHL